MDEFVRALPVVHQQAEGLPIVVSVSGGKDSTATILALREAQIDARYVFADTGWESTHVYEYIDYLRQHLGIEIDTVRSHLLMEERILRNAGFPMRNRRWCTRDLKVEPIRKYHDKVKQDACATDTVSVLGVRAQESAKRAGLLQWEWDSRWGGLIWRPIIDWTIEDVLRMHKRHGVAVNPLYQLGFDRVGCFPCIYATKREIRMISDIAPERIDLIRTLERKVAEERVRREEETPGRHSVQHPTFFNADARGLPTIDDVVTWARTEHGGRQFPLFNMQPEGGCFQWGLCDLPDDASDDNTTK